MKLSRIVDPRFQEAFKKLMSEPLPLKTAFKMKGIYSRIQAEADRYEETRKAALTRFGKKDENGELLVDEQGQVNLEGSSVDAFMHELNELLAVSVDIGQVNLEDLGNNLKMTTEEILVLDEVIKV